MLFQLCTTLPSKFPSRAPAASLALSPNIHVSISPRADKMRTACFTSRLADERNHEILEATNLLLTFRVAYTFVVSLAHGQIASPIRSPIVYPTIWGRGSMLTCALDVRAHPIYIWIRQRTIEPRVEKCSTRMLNVSSRWCTSYYCPNKKKEWTWHSHERSTSCSLEPG